jgi:multiple sugar transport system ATP-binding protein
MEGLSGNNMTLGIRPEHIRFSNGDAIIEAHPNVIERLGIHTVAYTTIADNPNTFCALLEGSAPAKVGTAMSMGFMAADCHLFAEDGNAFERRIPLTEIDPTLMIPDTD